MNIQIHPTWKSLLHREFQKDYFKNLINFVKKEYSTKEIFPPGKQIFRAFDLTPVDKVKVVILGQDPYHTPGVANGLSFSVNEGQLLPPSLKNIYKELKSDLGVDRTNSGDLTRWAEQGVLLLNASLTVEKGKANSHQGKGWELFTDEAIQAINDVGEHIVFILWGKFAQDKGNNIDEKRHLVINSPHPSPFSADKGFFGSKPFSKANTYLIKHGIKPIDW